MLEQGQKPQHAQAPAPPPGGSAALAQTLLAGLPKQLPPGRLPGITMGSLGGSFKASPGTPHNGGITLGGLLPTPQTAPRTLPQRRGGADAGAPSALVGEKPMGRLLGQGVQTCL